MPRIQVQLFGTAKPYQALWATQCNLCGQYFLLKHKPSLKIRLVLSLSTSPSSNPCAILNFIRDQIDAADLFIGGYIYALYNSLGRGSANSQQGKVIAHVKAIAQAFKDNGALEVV